MFHFFGKKAKRELEELKQSCRGVPSAREFSIEHLIRHKRLHPEHVVETHPLGGWVCKNGCMSSAGPPIGDVQKYIDLLSSGNVINGSIYPTAPEYTFPKD